MSGQIIVISLAAACSVRIIQHTNRLTDNSPPLPPLFDFIHPFCLPALGESKDGIEVLSARNFCRKMKVGIPVICGKTGVLQAIKGPVLAHILRGGLDCLN